MLPVNNIMQNARSQATAETANGVDFLGRYQAFERNGKWLHCLPMSSPQRCGS